MSSIRTSTLRVLFVALMFVFLVGARASAEEDEEEVEWACTATCGNSTAYLAAHPCGTGEYAEPEDANDLDFSNCAKSFNVIMKNINYTTATHVVPCPTDVCVSKCATLGEATNGTFQCFNASTLMSATEKLANNRGLAMGCPGSHYMSDMAAYMAGHGMGDCEASHVHFAHDSHDSAAYAISSVVAVVSTVALAFALA